MYCENVIKDVRSFLSDKQSQAMIKQYMDAACSIIPVASIAKECQDMVDNDLPAILDLIVSELDPQMICSVMGLCSGLKDRVQHGSPVVRTSTMKIPALKLEPICTDCKKFMTDIKDLVTSKTTEQELEQMIEQQLCSQLGQFENECKALVEAYVPELLELLVNEMDPDMICSAAGFCNATGCPKVMLAKMRLRKSPLYQEVAQVSDSAECEICKTILGELQDLDRSATIQQEIEAFLKDNICSQLGALKGSCEETVDQYAPELFELIATELDPATRCQGIGFCTPPSLTTFVRQSPVKVSPPAPKPVSASAQCVMCEFVMKQLEQMLGDNSTESEIIDALEKVCSLLPETVAAECKSFVDLYGPAVIALLEQELDPKQICTAIGLCSATDIIDTVVVTGSELCGVCETLIGYLDAILEQNATVKEIEAAVEKVCNFLPDPYKNECDTIVETYGPLIVQLISQFADPNEVCTAVGLCGNTTKVVQMSKIQPAKAQLLGVNECTYGPAFWCLSRENAEKCKAVAHCTKHVWKN